MSKQLFKEKSPVLKEVCASCNLEIGRSGTMTGWIFTENRCKCTAVKRTHSLVVASPDKPNNEESSALKNPDSSKAGPAPVDLGPDYEVLSVLGQGGMGTVYKVRDKRLDKLFAAKVLSSELTKDALSVRRFEQEAEAASSLSHANIATIYSHNVSPDQTHFLIMEYVDGISLDKLLPKHSPGLEFATDIFIQICDALEHAHAHGIVHRDLKPANILIAENEQGVSVVKIVDFGIAKMAATAKRQTLDLTQTGELFGSPSYMSPEQCLGFECDARSDIYSMGCIMYEAISGRAPFVEQNVIQTIVRHLDAPPKPLQSNIFLRMPDSMNYAIMRALEKDPQARYQTAQALKKDLELIQAGKKTKAPRRVRSALPIQFAIIAALDLVLLIGSFTQYSGAVSAKFKAHSVISEANAVSKLFYDAGVAVGGYSITKNSLFASRYEMIVKQIPEDIKTLEDLLGDDVKSLSSLTRVSKLTDSGLKTLSDARTSIDSASADANQLQARHMYKEIRETADKLQVELGTLTESSKKIATDSSWMVRANSVFAIELLLLLIGNVALVGTLVRRQEKNSRRLMWLGQAKPIELSKD